MFARFCIDGGPVSDVAQVLRRRGPPDFGWRCTYRSPSAKICDQLRACQKSLNAQVLGRKGGLNSSMDTSSNSASLHTVFTHVLVSFLEVSDSPSVRAPLRWASQSPIKKHCKPLFLLPLLASELTLKYPEFVDYHGFVCLVNM